MTDQGAVKELLRELSEPKNGAGRVVSANSPSELRANLMAEIKRTLLPRQLSFTNDVDEKISLDVSNGRIIRVAGALPKKLVTIDKFIGESISKEDKNMIVALNDLVEKFVSRATVINIASDLLTEKSSSLDAGVSISTISSISTELGPVPDMPEANRVELFAAKVKPITEAWVLLKQGSPSSRHGKTDIVKKLQDFLDTEQQAMHHTHDRNYPDVRDTGFAIRSQMSDDGQCLIYGWESETVILAVANRSYIPDLLSQWSQR